MEKSSEDTEPQEDIELGEDAEPQEDIELGEDAEPQEDLRAPEEELVILDISSNNVKIESSEDKDLEITDDEHKLVNDFLDGKIEFNDYFDNISGTTKEEVEDVPVDKVEAKREKSKRPEGTTRSGGRGFAVRTLPAALKGLMGEANLRLAKGDRETAAKICFEVMRQAPSTAEPFHSLATIYEEMGDELKSLQMSLVAAHLSPTDAGTWANLAETCERLGDAKQAITCYNKAIADDLQNLDLHRKRAVLLESAGEKKTVIRGYMRLLYSLRPDQEDYVIYLAKFIAEMCHKENDIPRASEALDVAIIRCPTSVNLEFVNLQLELVLQLKNYKRALELMESFCNLTVQSKEEDGNIIIEKAILPEITEIDIIAKLIVILIHFNASNLVPDFIQSIVNLGPSVTGDLYLDIVDAFTEKGNHECADPLLDALINCEDYNLPGVWLKYAENQRLLNKLENACKGYSKVLEHAPQHSEARLNLASTLEKLGRRDEAINVLAEGDQTDFVDVKLLYKRCMLLKDQPERAQELIVLSQLLFSRHSMKVRNRNELKSVSSYQRLHRKRGAIKLVRRSLQEPEEDEDVPKFGGEGPPLDEEWALFKYVCNLCYELKMFPTLQKLAITSQLSKLFQAYRQESDLFTVIAAYMNKDSFGAYNILRSMALRGTNNSKMWHLLNMVIHRADECRHTKLVMRQLARDCDHLALEMLHGNDCLVAGTYKYALHEYSTIFHKSKTALSAMLLSLTYSLMAGQKFISKKHQLVTQMVALFVRYEERRGPEGQQEVHYNLGRGLHHLGLYTTAIYHYKKVLELRESTALCREKPHLFDLSREAAFNLHLIYMQSENPSLARMYLNKYVVV